jgi:hypothetical protein
VRLFAFVTGATVAAVFAVPIAGAAVLSDITSTLMSFLMAAVALYAAVLIAMRVRTRKTRELPRGQMR